MAHRSGTPRSPSRRCWRYVAVSLFLGLQLIFLCAYPCAQDTPLTLTLRSPGLQGLGDGSAEAGSCVGGGLAQRLLEQGGWRAAPGDMAVGIALVKLKLLFLDALKRATEHVLERSGSVFLFWWNEDMESRGVLRRGQGYVGFAADRSGPCECGVDIPPAHTIFPSRLSDLSADTQDPWWVCSWFPAVVAVQRPAYPHRLLWPAAQSLLSSRRTHTTGLIFRSACRTRMSSCGSHR